MNIIFGNFGNQTIALIQYAHEQAFNDVYVISVDTGWAAETWQSRVEQGEALARQYGFKVVRLSSKASFADLVRDRQQFPSKKFQWCAGFLKGLPLLDWLDQHDSACEATIILGKRRADSRANAKLTEFIDESEHYGERRVWHPLYKYDDSEFAALIERAGFEVLEHRSLECDPCIHNTSSDFRRMSDSDIKRLRNLEVEVHKLMFREPIDGMVGNAHYYASEDENKEEQFYMGCGSPFACGE